MLLYIHTKLLHTYTGLKITNKPNSKMLTAWHLRVLSTPHQGSAGRCLKCSHHRLSLHELLTRERQNVKMLAEEQPVSYSCLFFFLLKKPLNVEVLSSPRRKSREHHQSPGFKGRADASLSKAPGPEGPQAGSKGPSSRLFQEVWFPTVALVPDHGPLKKSVNLAQWRLTPKVCVSWGTCLSKCPEHEV